jgi:hypothetical protein
MTIHLDDHVERGSNGSFFLSSKTRRRNGAGHGGGNLGNKVTNTFPLFFSKLNRTSGHVNMPGGRALSAHGAGKLIVKTDGQTKTEKDTYAKLYLEGNRVKPQCFSCHVNEKNDPEYRDVWVVYKHVQDPKSHLWFHVGNVFSYRKSCGDYMKRLSNGRYLKERQLSPYMEHYRS